MNVIGNWGDRALAHARAIARTPRGSASQAETEAARYVQMQLAALGVADVRMQAFRGLRSIWLFLAQAFGLALVGHAAYWLLRSPLGGWLAWLISLLAFALSSYLILRKFTFRDYLLRETLPHGPSQNVLAAIPPAGDVQRTVVLVGHLDSHRSVFWYANDFLVKFYALSGPVALYGAFIAPFLYALAELTGLQLFTWVGVYIALNHFLGWLTGMTADLAPYSPGANDNAAAVGTILTLAERLKAQPLRHTRVWLALTGCEETGCDGLLALLKEHGEELRDALFLDFELVGIGERLVYLQSEGMIRRRTIPADVQRLVTEAGRDFGLQPIRATIMGVFTEAGTAWEHGYKAVCILAQRQNSPLLPEWHRLTDTPDRLQAETLERVHSLAWEILQHLDQ